jgi:DNA polymerase elongation subunit (family B)
VADERSLLEAFIKMVMNNDIDIFVGYEIQMNSLGYLIERAQTLRKK